MRRAALVLALLLAACGGQSAQQDSGSYAEPAKPPLKADPKAGPPALLVSTGRDVLVLDPRARIRRVLYLSGLTSICPGGRVLADAADMNAEVEVVSIGGKRRWHKRIPRRSVHRVVCLDAKGERVLVVTNRTFPEPDDPQTVYLVDRGRTTELGPKIDWAGATTPTRLYDSGSDGRLTVHELPSMRPLRTYEGVPSASWLHVSDDERWAALTTLGLDETQLTLLDLQTGATRPVAGDDDVHVAGWLAPDQLVLHERDEVRILGPDLRVRERIDDVEADSVHVIDGALIATDGARVYTLRGPSPFAEGTLPESVSVLGTL